MPAGVWFTAPRTAELRAEEVAPPAAGELQVRAIRSMVSPGSEMNLYRGEGNLPGLYSTTAVGQLPFPIKFGYEIVGEVRAVGSGVSGWQVGDLAFCAHPHQDFFNLPADGQAAMPLPTRTDPRTAVFSALFRTSLNSLLDTPVRPGDRVAVSGLGLVGLFCAYLARSAASRLVVIDPLPERRRSADWVRADAVVDPAEAGTAIHELTDGRGVDLFIEASGNPRALQLGLETTGAGGSINATAWYGTRRAELQLSPEFHLRRQRILSSQIRGLAEGQHAGWDNQRALAYAIEEVEKIGPGRLITHELPFEQAPDAYRLIDRTPELTLGVHLTYAPGADPPRGS